MTARAAVTSAIRDSGNTSTPASKFFRMRMRETSLVAGPYAGTCGKTYQTEY
jgi:hypothetical protein